MKILLMIVGLFLFHISATAQIEPQAGAGATAQESMAPNESFKSIELLFEKFITDNRDNSEYNIAMVKRFNEAIAKSKTDGTVLRNLQTKKAIVELYTYVNLETQDYKLILGPQAQDNLFDSLIRNITDKGQKNEYDNYANAVVGYYYENVEKKYNEAENYYKKAFETGKTFTALMVWRSMNYFRSNGSINTVNKDSAKAWLLYCLKSTPGCVSAYICSGHYAAWDGDPAAAAGYFSKAISLSPNSMDAYNGPGFWYNRRKQYDLAIDYFEKVIKDHPRFVKAMTNLGNSYKNKGTTEYYQKAIAVYKLCIAIDPMDTLYYDNIAEIYSENLSNDSAGYYYNEEARIDPRTSLKTGNYYYNKKKDYGNAIKYYKAYARIKPTPRLFEDIGDCYTLISDDSAKLAIPMYKMAIQLDAPTNPQNYRYKQIAFLFNGTSQYDSSIYYYTKLMQLDISPEDKRAYAFDIGFPYRNKAYIKTEVGNYPAMYKIYKEGANNNNRGCKFMAFALQSEFGYDDNEVDPDKAKFNYKEAAQLWPFNKPGIEGILRLYREKKIAMDPTDYNIWRQMDSVVLKSRFFKVSTHGDNRIPKQSSIKLFPTYPPGVHPLKWEEDRLKEDFGLIIDQKEKDRIANEYRKGQEDGNGYFYTKSATSKEDISVTAETYRKAAYDYYEKGQFDSAFQTVSMGLKLAPDNKILIRIKCLILVASGKTQEAFETYDKFRNIEYPGLETVKYREIFLIDVENMRKLFPDKSIQIEQAKLYLYSAKEKLRLKYITYKDVLASKDPQMLYDAAVYFADTWVSDSIRKSFACYENLIALKDSSIYNSGYLDAIARLKDVAPDEKYNPVIKKIDALFESSGYTDIEKLMVKWRLHIINDENFKNSFDKQIQLYAGKQYWSDLMYIAKQYKSIAKEEENPNKKTLLFVAHNAIDIYTYVHKNMPAAQDDYNDIISLIADRCGEFAFTIILLGDNVYALKAAQLAHTCNADEEYAKTNLPLSLVLTGDFESGKALYLEYQDQQFSEEKKFRKVFLDDIDDLRTKGFDIGRLTEIETLLKKIEADGK